MSNQMTMQTLSFSILNYIKTGNIIIDTILIFFGSTILIGIVSYLSTLQEKFNNFSLRSWYLTWKLSHYKSVILRYETGHIKHTTIDSSYRNHLDNFMIEAILYVLGTKGITTDQLVQYNGTFYSDHSKCHTLNELYKNGKISFHPRFVVQYNKMYFEYSTHDTCHAETEYTKRKRSLAIYSPNSIKEIETFIQECINVYADLKHPEFDYRQIYAIKYSDKLWEKYEKIADKDCQRPLNEFYYYDFNPRKTRNDVFFEEKDLLFKKYQEFLTDPKQDKFCVLLYGSPGTGKSSLVEAFANEFNLSIMESCIDDFIDEQELIDFFHNDTIYKKENNKDKNQQQEFIQIPLDKRLYLFEDFDSSSKAVLDRKKFQWNSEDVSSSSTDDDTSSEDEDEQKKKQKKKKKEKKKDKKNMFDVKQVKQTEIADMVLNAGITLKSLLNVFGGVFKLEKSVIFITTNHLDVIDPALIRPGRVNFRIHLDTISYEIAIEMINHLNSTIDTEHPKLQELLKTKKLLPCQLEQFCNMSEDTNDLIDYLMG